MTELTKVVRRKLPRSIDRTQWTVTLDSVGVTFREVKHKTKFPVSWDAIWQRAMEITAEAARKERLAKRKARRSAWSK